jgi:hypothetical protein
MIEMFVTYEGEGRSALIIDFAMPSLGGTEEENAMFCRMSKPIARAHTICAAPSLGGGGFLSVLEGFPAVSGQDHRRMYSQCEFVILS